MANVNIICEVLCFILNKFGKKLQKANLKSILLGFYTDEELYEAKEVLFADAATLQCDALPRNVKRAKGENRARLIAEDILDLLAFLDEKQVVGQLPVYVARDLERIPNVKPEDMDLFCVSTKMEAIEKRLAAVESVNMEVVVKKLDNICVQLDGQQSSLKAVADQLDRGTQVNNGPSAIVQAARAEEQDGHITAADPYEAADGSIAVEARWASVAVEGVETNAAPQTWQTVSRTKPTSRQRPSIRVQGAKELSESAAIRSIPRPIPRAPQKSVLAAFVGRLHNDTTEESLTRFLMDEGMKGIVCRKLKAKNGKTYKTAAFYVTCAAESIKLFYDENCWPAGVELRDWVYK